MSPKVLALPMVIALVAQIVMLVTWLLRSKRCWRGSQLPHGFFAAESRGRLLF
jgi:hypothetical protein